MMCRNGSSAVRMKKTLTVPGASARKSGTQFSARQRDPKKARSSALTPGLFPA
jgi:hypothetical protein